MPTRKPPVLYAVWSDTLSGYDTTPTENKKEAQKALRWFKRKYPASSIRLVKLVPQE